MDKTEEKSKLWTPNFVLGSSSNFFLSASFYGVAPVLPVLLTRQGQGNVGLVMGIFSVTMITMRFLGGWISDNLGRKKVGLIALLGVTSFTAAYMFAGEMGLILLLMLRLCHGAVHGLSATSVTSLVSTSLHDERQAQGMSIAGAFGMASTAVMPFIALKTFEHSASLWGISISVCAVLGFFCILLMRMPAESSRPRKKFQWGDLLEKDKGVWLISISVVGISLVHGAISSYIPLYAEENHIADSVLGMFYILYSAGIFLSRLAVGRRLDDRVKEQGDDPRACFTYFYSSLVTLGLGVIVLVIFPYSFGLLCAAILIAGGFGTANLALLSYALKSTPSERAGSVSGTYYTCYELGILGGGLLFFVANWTGYTHMWLVALPAIAGTAVLIRKLRSA